MKFFVMKLSNAVNSFHRSDVVELSVVLLFDYSYTYFVGFSALLVLSI